MGDVGGGGEGVDFAHFGLESGIVSRELRACTNVFIVSIPNELEREICQFEFGNVFPNQCSRATSGGKG